MKTEESEEGRKEGREAKGREGKERDNDRTHQTNKCECKAEIVNKQINEQLTSKTASK